METISKLLKDKKVTKGDNHGFMKPSSKPSAIKELNLWVLINVINTSSSSVSFFSQICLCSTKKKYQKCLVLCFSSLWITKNCLQYSVRKQPHCHFPTQYKKGNSFLTHLMLLFIIQTHPRKTYCHLYFASVTTSESLLSFSPREKK